MTTAPDTMKDPAVKRAAISLLTRGLITKAEAARLAGVTPQAVQKWTKAMPVTKTREAVLAKLWNREIRRRGLSH